MFTATTNEDEENSFSEDSELLQSTGVTRELMKQFTYNSQALLALQYTQDQACIFLQRYTLLNGETTTVSNSVLYMQIIEILLTDVTKSIPSWKDFPGIFMTKIQAILSLTPYVV